MAVAAGDPEPEVRLRVPEVGDLSCWLRGQYPGGDSALFLRSRDVLKRFIGPEVSLRGLVEFSNRCRCGCWYCGIRRAAPVRRFDLTDEEILQTARFCRDQGFGSMTLQSGERRDPGFIERVEALLRCIKRETRTSVLRDGLGITLCVGEQTKETYERFFEAGSHRYLLRIETSDPVLYNRLHPSNQRWDDRVSALHTIKSIGYQLGTGVMIGFPGQSEDHLANDVLFFRSVGADMIGMGPYIPSEYAPDHLKCEPVRSVSERLRLSLRMIAATRIVLKDVNIAATTALQALSPAGREAGLTSGANVMMPIVTPLDYRSRYQLYDGKPCVDEDSTACGACTPLRAARAGRPIVKDRWGDAPHAKRIHR
ncbi:MAG: [FeFe] hydrogenase H-cluster radical SAM maturase HydE [Spirochaeta sp.]|jgi:biotin synthase|nr:[FeFe] hydrogenase H-cluster radical SAM maturase HydE [Spirochaeta sp.]